MTLCAGPVTRARLAARTGCLSQGADVRLMTLGDGVERGIRILEFRTGSGLRCTVLVDRAMDWPRSSATAARGAGTAAPASVIRRSTTARAKAARPGDDSGTSLVDVDLRCGDVEVSG